MPNRWLVSLAVLPALFLAACGGSEDVARSSDPTKESTGPGQQLCLVASAAAVQEVVGSDAGAGTPVTIDEGSAACTWQSGTDAALAIAVFADAGALPEGDSANSQFAELVGLSADGFSNTSLFSRTADGRAVAALVLNNGTSMPEQAVTAILDSLESVKTPGD